jgi:hypothetical protein
MPVLLSDKKIHTRIVIFAILSTVIFYSLIIMPAYSRVICCPVINTANHSVLGSLIGQMTQNTIINRYKGILAQRLNIKYSFDNLMLRALPGHGLDALVNFMPNIDPALNNIARGGINITNDIMSSSSFNQRFSGTVNNAMQNELKSIFRERTGVNVPPDISDITSMYNRFLSSNEVTNLYSSHVNLYRHEMINELRSVSSINRHILNLGATLDLSDSSVYGRNVSNSVNSLTKEAFNIHRDAVEYVDIVYGHGIRRAIHDPYSRGNDFTSLNRGFIGMRSGLNGATICDDLGNNCVTLNDEDAERLIRATNSESIAQTEKILIENEGAVNRFAGNNYGEISDKMEAEVARRSNIIRNVIAQDKRNDYFTSVEYFDRVRQDIKAIGVGDIETVATLDKIDPRDTRMIVRLIRGSKGTPKIIREANVDRLVAAHRAIKVAEEMKEKLKRYSLADINAGYSDQAWKSFFRFYYYYTLLQNETLRLKSLSVQANASFIDTKAIEKSAKLKDRKLPDKDDGEFMLYEDGVGGGI